jgi:hypothetical protein
VTFSGRGGNGIDPKVHQCKFDHLRCSGHCVYKHSRSLKEEAAGIRLMSVERSRDREREIVKSIFRDRERERERDSEVCLVASRS